MNTNRGPAGCVACKIGKGSVNNGFKPGLSRRECSGFDRGCKEVEMSPCRSFLLLFSPPHGEREERPWPPHAPLNLVPRMARRWFPSANVDHRQGLVQQPGFGFQFRSDRVERGKQNACTGARQSPALRNKTSRRIGDRNSSPLTHQVSCCFFPFDGLPDLTDCLNR
jgi:hypothetical protein